MSDSINTTPPVDQPKRSLMIAISALIGGAAASELMGAGALSVAQAFTAREGDTSKEGLIFCDSEMATLKAICQTVIPKTDTLGAGDVDVHGFIDNQLFHCHTPESQARVKNVIRAINAVARKSSNNFVSLSAAEHHALLVKIDTPDGGFSKTNHDDFRFLKSLIIFGYYTSQEGASKELLYIRYPGDYKGSVPYESIGRDYGAHGYY